MISMLALPPVLLMSFPLLSRWICSGFVLPEINKSSQACLSFSAFIYLFIHQIYFFFSLENPKLRSHTGRLFADGEETVCWWSRDAPGAGCRLSLQSDACLSQMVPAVPWGLRVSWINCRVTKFRPWVLGWGHGQPPEKVPDPGVEVPQSTFLKDAGVATPTTTRHW